LHFSSKFSGFSFWTLFISFFFFGGGTFNWGGGVTRGFAVGWEPGDMGGPISKLSVLSTEWKTKNINMINLEKI
jgi:hypothetical protein